MSCHPQSGVSLGLWGANQGSAVAYNCGVLLVLRYGLAVSLPAKVTCSQASQERASCARGFQLPETGNSALSSSAIRPVNNVKAALAALQSSVAAMPACEARHFARPMLRTYKSLRVVAVDLSY